MSVPKVFISYAHEGKLSDQVSQLAEFLLSQGIQAITDHPYVNRPPQEGWRTWMQHQIEDADVVLMVCSATYKTHFERRAPDTPSGLGVTWESALITADLYTAKLQNEKFFPILPDDGLHEHVPKILLDWHNNHRFPSGYQRIVALIQEEIRLPKPERPIQRTPPCELVGQQDPRLQPRESYVIGRQTDIADVVQFLHGQATQFSVCGQIIGTGGIGKTEVCKAALRAWLSTIPNTRAFWIQVADDADGARLLQQLALGIGLTDEQSTLYRNVTALAPHLPHGLYYLDNLESVVQSSHGLSVLRELTRLPHKRWLCSSRIELSTQTGGQTIQIDRLTTDDAVALFLLCWPTQRPKPPTSQLQTFVNQQLLPSSFFTLH